MKILLAVETLLIGGAEKFVIEMASELAENNEVHLFVMHPDLVNRSYEKKLRGKARIHYPNYLLFILANQLDRIFNKLKVRLNALSSISIRKVEAIIARHHVDVVHSNQFNVDFVCAKALRQRRGVAHVSTVHGDYVNFYNRYRQNIPVYGNFDFKSKLQYVLAHIQCLVCLSNQQVSFFESLKLEGVKVPRVARIYNGIKKPMTHRHHLENDAFIFGMVARGIKEKGWEHCIKAFKKLEFEKARLILVGGGGYIEDLKAKYADARIFFAGHVDDPSKYISSMNVGLLPTTYSSESLPTSVIEYLSYQKPVIATNVGEIMKMIETPNGLAGVIIETDNIENDLATAMRSFYEDRVFYELCQGMTKEAFKKFSIQDCVKNYDRLYKDLIAAAK